MNLDRATMHKIAHKMVRELVMERAVERALEPARNEPEEAAGISRRRTRSCRFCTAPAVSAGTSSGAKRAWRSRR